MNLEKYTILQQDIFNHFFCLTVPSVVFTNVLISPDGTNWSPTNFFPVKIGPTGYSR